MEILIFLVVIVALIVVHEFGHLVAAKWCRMRVDEFGIGYPPRAAKIGEIGGTRITLNWLPFGGFVKIYGEDAEGDDPRAFNRKNRFLQALVLLAGIAMNLLFAYLLISLALMFGTPRALSGNELSTAQNVQLAVAGTLTGSPAAAAGLQTSDIIEHAFDARGTWETNEARDPQSFSDFVVASRGAPITIEIERDNAPLAITLAAKQGISPDDPNAYALGIDIAPIGVTHLPFFPAFSQGASFTTQLIKATAVGLWGFFAGVFTLHANLSEVTGPVGIANALGSAATIGFGDVLSLAALISINLALINLIPVPALDGGRLLFVAIESVIRRPIKPAVAATVNAVGFAFLILLMFAVTAHDIFVLL